MAAGTGLRPGTRIGHYEIVGSLGAGGMGQVYRAKDGRLNRDVAIKILPETFATDRDRVSRFTREAQTLASLSHPNIAHVYGLEDAPPAAAGLVPSQALVMELVEGKDLSAILARERLSMADALAIARQIADALEAAHEHGIVHRDLKPANVKVRDDGSTKVLDFGLAKALTPAADGASHNDLADSPTMTSPATGLGMILGTAAYMSPEQAKGRAVDRRADIWAFGVVLYEMLTGTRLFRGDDVAEVMASVLRTGPDWTALPAGTPASVHRLLRRCLRERSAKAAQCDRRCPAGTRRNRHCRERQGVACHAREPDLAGTRGCGERCRHRRSLLAVGAIDADRWRLARLHPRSPGPGDLRRLRDGGYFTGWPHGRVSGRRGRAHRQPALGALAGFAGSPSHREFTGGGPAVLFA
jgi:serine/threonine protein kinase